MAARLDATRREWAGLAYSGPDEALEDLTLVQDSLVAAGDARAAHGELQDVVWMLQTFGFHLAELEVRQHSAVHRAALTELLALLPAGGGRPTDPAAAASDVVVLDRLAIDGWPELTGAVSPATREVLDTLRVMAWLQQRWGRRSCGRYVVRSASRRATSPRCAPWPGSRSGPARWPSTSCRCSRPAPTSTPPTRPSRSGWGCPRRGRGSRWSTARSR